MKTVTFKEAIKELLADRPIRYVEEEFLTYTLRDFELVIDRFSHEDMFEIQSVNPKLEIPITAHDIEEFKSLVNNGTPISWIFETDKGQSIDIVFIAGD